MSEKELNEAMQYNLDYTEAMLNDELFGTNEVAEVKLLASEKAIKDLQQKVEQLEKDKSYANWYAVKKEKKVEQLENIRKEAIKATKDVKQFVYDELVDRNVSGATETHCKIMDLLNILNKGSEE